MIALNLFNAFTEEAFDLNQAISEVVKSSPGIRYLHLGGSKINYVGLLAIAKFCKKLEWLDLTNVSLRDTYTWTLFNCFPNLKSLVLKGCAGITEQHLKLFLEPQKIALNVDSSLVNESMQEVLKIFRSYVLPELPSTNDLTNSDVPNNVEAPILKNPLELNIY